MNRHDGPRPRGDGRRDRLRVDGVVVRADVDEHRPGPGALDGAHGGHGRMGNRDYLVARPDAGRPEAQLDRIGPVGHSDSVPAAQVLGAFRFKRLDLGPKNVPAAGENPLSSRPIARRIGREAIPQVVEWDGERGHRSSLTPAQIRAQGVPRHSRRGQGDLGKGHRWARFVSSHGRWLPLAETSSPARLVFWPNYLSIQELRRLTAATLVRTFVTGGCVGVNVMNPPNRT